MCSSIKPVDMIASCRVLLVGLWVIIPFSMAQHNDKNTYSISAGSYYFSGCYSRKNFEVLMSKGSSKAIFYNHIFAWENCFELCSIYSSQFPPENINVIAIQLRSCVCITLPHPIKDLILYEVDDFHCDQIFLAERYNLGGKFAFAVYCENNDTCLREKTRPFPEYEVFVNETEVDQSYSTLDNKISPCVTENCTIRFDYEGQICTNLVTAEIQSKLNALSDTVNVLNKYIPGSESNPALCIKYCRNQYIYNLNDEKLHPSIYSVLSIHSGYYQDFGICQCTNNLESFYPVKFENCEQCSNNSDHCTSLQSKQMLYYNNINELGINPRPAICSSSSKCSALDIYGTNWSACPGELKKEKCPNTLPLNSNDWSYWQCSLSGKFVGLQPDFNNCTTNQLMHIINNAEGIQSHPKEMLNDLEDVVLAKQYFGHEILLVNLLVKNLSRNIISSEITDGQRKQAVEIGVETVGNLMAYKDPWRQLDNKSKLQTATDLTLSFESILFNFAEERSENLTENIYSVYPIVNDKSGFVVTLVQQNQTDGMQAGIRFPPNSQESYIEILNIPEADIQSDLNYVSILINSTYLDELLPPFENNLKNVQPSESKIFNGGLISLTFFNETISKLAAANGVEIKITHQVPAVGQEHTNFRRKLHPGEQRKFVQGETTCVYWDTVNLTWSDKGCIKLNDRSNSEHTVCKCDHLTAFALLTDVHGYIGKERGLKIITLILCPTSMLCLIATIISLHRWSILNKERTTIISHLCANLVIANLFLLLLVDRDHFYLSQTSCVIVGILTHYAFLVAFGWMAVQGVYLYRMVVTVFGSTNDLLYIYTKGAYIYPLFPVGLTCGIGFGLGAQPYAGEMYCWLNGNYIWGFLAPAGIILAGNFIVMLITLRVICQRESSKLKKISKSSQNNSKRRKLILGSVSLSILLGLTWIVGFFAVVDTRTYFMAYLFTILNASQGILIFIFNCLLQEKFQIFVKKKFGKLIKSALRIDTCENSTPEKQGELTVSTGLLSSKTIKRNDCLVIPCNMKYKGLSYSNASNATFISGTNDLEIPGQNEVAESISDNPMIVPDEKYNNLENSVGAMNKYILTKETSDADKNNETKTLSMEEINTHIENDKSYKAMKSPNKMLKESICADNFVETTVLRESNSIDIKRVDSNKIGGKLYEKNQKVHCSDERKPFTHNNKENIAINFVAGHLENDSDISTDLISGVNGNEKPKFRAKSSGALKLLFLAPYKEEMMSSKLFLRQSENIKNNSMKN